MAPKRRAAGAGAGTPSLDETHDPGLTSWVESANAAGADFPIQNLPFGLFVPAKGSGTPRIGVAIGDRIVDLASLGRRLAKDPFFASIAPACAAPGLEGIMALDGEGRTELRRRLSGLLRAGAGADRKGRGMVEAALVPMRQARMILPAAIGDYTDFYASIHHATNIGRMFRPDQPLMPNSKWIPIGYHGRASSIVISGTPIRRPCGQTREDGAGAPSFGPTRALDYELEVGCLIGGGNEQGRPLSIGEAERQMFGLCLVNDWSARDMQRWEYQPLGPFLSKSFATTMSPWIVTLEALAPFRAAAFRRPPADPQPLPHLDTPQNRARGGFDINLEVLLSTARMSKARTPPQRFSRGNTADLYWTFAQMLAHHASNGCNLRPGDLIASGTVSGEAQDSRGCLMELTRRGEEPIRLPGGETRRFLEDGDEVILRAWCERAGARRIGFGECRGRVIPAG